jgi:hypothetical protein
MELSHSHVKTLKHLGRAVIDLIKQAWLLPQSVERAVAAAGRSEFAIRRNILQNNELYPSPCSLDLLGYGSQEDC